MAYYIKVTQQVCKKLGHGADRNDTADNNKLLWQADINTIVGETIFDRAAAVGGVALTAQQAKIEFDGCEYPIEVHTPPEYMDEEQPAETPSETPKDELPSDDIEENQETAPSENPSQQAPVENEEEANTSVEPKTDAQ